MSESDCATILGELIINYICMSVFSINIEAE